MRRRLKNHQKPFHQLVPTEGSILYTIGRNIWYLEDIYLDGMQQPRISNNCGESLIGELMEKIFGHVARGRRGRQDCSRLVQTEERVKFWCNVN